MAKRALLLLLGLAAPGAALAYVLGSSDWTWQTAPIDEPWLLNTSGWTTADGGATELIAVIEDAMDVWYTQGQADVVYTYGGTTTASYSGSTDGINSINFDPGSYGSGSATLAVASSWYYTSSTPYEKYECDIRFFGVNTYGTIYWNTATADASSTETDMRHVAEHELGHCWGLDHSADSTAIMYSTTPKGASGSTRNLSADDIAGIQAIYGAGCADLDGDGYSVSASCPDGGGDCDDLDSAVRPDATEACNGIDDDCDGGVDEGYDADGDGWATCFDDCDDADPDSYPGAAELCDGLDNDCDGAPDPDEIDEDGDGSLACDDCDDADPTVSPDLPDDCDGIDNNCDGSVDGATLTTASFADSSGYFTSTRLYGGVYQVTDPSGLLLHRARFWTLPPSGTTATFYVFRNTGTTGTWTLIGSSPATYTEGVAGWAESGDLDLSLTTGTYYWVGLKYTAASNARFYTDTTPTFTAAGGLTPIGYGSSSASFTTTLSMSTSTSYLLYQQLDLWPASLADTDGDGVSAWCGDCSTDPAIYPGQAEACDGIDNDCDGTVDDGFDADGDGWRTCDGDCDDGNPYVHPGATDTCNYADDDCNGIADDGLRVNFHPDADGDLHGDASITQGLCADNVPAAYDGWLADTDWPIDDCDDTDAAVYPGAPELCDGLDQDCDGSPDLSELTDADADGALACDDCDDADPTSYPGAPELCDGVANDCDATGWTDAEEDGLVTFFGDDGSVTDRTATWAAGHAGAAVNVTLDTAGTTNACTGTWYVRLRGPSSGSTNVQGLPDAGSVWINAGGSGSALTLSTAGVTLNASDLTLTGGNGTGSPTRRGGGVYASNGTLTLTDSLVTTNTATQGGGIYSAATLTLSNTDVRSNTATNGAGMYLNAARNVTMTNSDIRDNVATTTGGGVYAANLRTLTCSGSSTEQAGFHHNSAASGGAVYLATSTMTLRSTACDWGTSAATSVNSPQDILYVTAAYNYGENASFTCRTGTCP